MLPPVSYTLQWYFKCSIQNFPKILKKCSLCTGSNASRTCQYWTHLLLSRCRGLIFYAYKKEVYKKEVYTKLWESKIGCIDFEYWLFIKRIVC